MRSCRGGLWTGCLIFIFCVESAFSEVKIWGRLGGDVELKQDVVPENGGISGITWKEGKDLAITWDGDKLATFRQFKERGRLNTSTGAMTISRLIQSDSNVYTPIINDQVGTSVRLEVISDVPLPILKPCKNPNNTCTLVCEGHTEGAGEVIYTWKADNNILHDVSTSSYTFQDDESDVKEFSCEMKNEFSQKSSNKIANPFFHDPNPEETGFKPNIPTGVTVFISLILCVIFLVLFHKCKTGDFFYEKTSLPWEADFWRKNERPQRDAESNGVARNQTDEETPIKETGNPS